jgi:Replication protein C N-terminal domain/Lipase (class 3)
MVQENCAEEALRRGFSHAPTGFRRMTPGLLRTDRSAEGFAGLPEGVSTPGQLLAALKAAAPRLGIAPRLVHAVDWLFRFTQPQDWERGGRPVVWRGRGTAIGLRQILRMQDGTESLETFLTGAPGGTPILITGHSLGGCLASALAPCVAEWVGSASSISVYTIAAPSPGNAHFAAYYNTLFTDASGCSTAFRFFNSLDVVPNAWASLNTVATYYPPLVSCPPDISNIINRAENAVGGQYAQLGEREVGSAIELSGTLMTPFGAHRGRLELNPFENALFLWEAAQQHACTTYQALLQTPFMVPAIGRVKLVLETLETACVS